MNHVLDCTNIDEWDEVNDCFQLVWIWCRTHKKFEWHSVTLDDLNEGNVVTTDKAEVKW